jgi:hypothetical protein
MVGYICRASRFFTDRLLDTRRGLPRDYSLLGDVSNLGSDLPELAEILWAASHERARCGHGMTMRLCGEKAKHRSQELGRKPPLVDTA